MQFRRPWMAVLIGLVVTPGLAQTTLNNPLDAPVPYEVVSDSLDNPFSRALVLHEEVVSIEHAAWLRVYFGDEVMLGQGSILRITSELDGEVQELDSAGLEAWGHSSAYFKGDTVRVELIGGPRTQGNRLAIERTLVRTISPEYWFITSR